MSENRGAVSLSIHRSLCRLTVEDLHFVLNNNEKLEMLPDSVISNVIYRLLLTEETQDIWKQDGYIWKNDKSIQYTRQQPDFTKIYYSCINSDKKKDSRCVKHVYISNTNKLDVIVCYMGNLDIANRRPHGNSKLTTSHVFSCTLSSTIKNIDALVSTMSGSKAYKQLIATNDGEDAPRNVAQCQYRRQKFLQQQRISNDEIKNLILLSFDFKGYFKLLQIQPDLVVVLIHDHMKDQFSKLLLTTKETIPLFYDTTFSLGEVYVSILAFRHVMFVEQPVLPLAIVLHDFKLEQSHNRFIQIFQHQIPVLPNHCVLITDGEDALKNAFRCYYPKLQQLRCWNHVGKNIKEAAKLYYLPAQQFPDIDSSDPTVIRKKKREIKSNLLDTITNLFRSTSKSDFTNEYNIISQTWPSKFRDWFNKNLLPTIDEFGGWTGRERNLFNEMSGVPNNPIESLNAVFKRWLAWKELALDSLTQMFFLVNGFYVNEVKRGFCGVGGYHLREAYLNSKTDAAFLSLVKSFSPDEAVNRMKDILKKQTPELAANDTSVLEDNDTSILEDNETSVLKDNDTSVLEDEQVSVLASDDDNAEDNIISNDDDHQTSTSSASQAINDTYRRQTLTNSARASLLNDQELVHFDPKSKVFVVRSLDQQVAHAVHMKNNKRLFWCSCSHVVENCMHVLSVKDYLGITIDNNNKVNLGHEKKRKRIEDKIPKSGGKRPRRCDKENNHSSPYFTSNNNTSTTNKPPANNNSSSSVSLPTSTLSLMTPLQNISNVSSLSAATGSTTPAIKTIRFISPINPAIIPSQQNQYIVIQKK